jgi:hypothetical protein
MSTTESETKKCLEGSRTNYENSERLNTGSRQHRVAACGLPWLRGPACLIQAARRLRTCARQFQSGRHRKSPHWCLKHVGRWLPTRIRCMCLFVLSLTHGLMTATAMPQRKFNVTAGGSSVVGWFGKFQTGRFGWSSIQFGNLHKDIFWTYRRQFTKVQSYCFSPILFEFTKDVAYRPCTIHTAPPSCAVSMWRLPTRLTDCFFLLASRLFSATKCPGRRWRLYGQDFALFL